MRLWRISNYTDLGGTGGLIASARWHSQKHPIVYLAENPASALLERLVHFEIDPEDLPSHYQLLEVDVPNELPFDECRTDGLPAGWSDSVNVTQALGNAWLTGSRTALMRVPSAIVPFTANWLLNPSHPDAPNCKIVAVTQAPFDRRLFQKR
jgi:RES domain-containing protein